MTDDDSQRDLVCRGLADDEPESENVRVLTELRDDDGVADAAALSEMEELVDAVSDADLGAVRETVGDVEDEKVSVGDPDTEGLDVELTDIFGDEDGVSVKQTDLDMVPEADNDLSADAE